MHSYPPVLPRMCLHPASRTAAAAVYSVISTGTSPRAPPQKLLGSGTEQALLPGAAPGAAADNAITRRGGARGAGGQGLAQRRVVVDVREFMSHLPAVLHQQGLELVPVTLEVPPPPPPPPRGGRRPIKTHMQACACATVVSQNSLARQQGEFVSGQWREISCTLEGHSEGILCCMNSIARSAGDARL